LYFQFNIECENTIEIVDKLNEINSKILKNPIYLDDFENIKIDFKSCDDDDYVVIGLEITDTEAIIDKSIV